MLAASIFSSRIQPCFLLKRDTSYALMGLKKETQGGAGVGGVLYNLRGKCLLDFSLNLGINSNNMAEAYAIYQGIMIAQVQQLNCITIIDDSKNIICYFVMGSFKKL
jgi:hypothetical protein